MPKKLLKIIWKVLSPGQASSPSKPSPVPGGGQGREVPNQFASLAYVLPVNCPRSQEFGENPGIYARWGFPGHNGIDFACPTGTPIQPANEGYIDRIGYEADGYGLYVRIDHDTFNIWTYYCHLLPGSIRLSTSAWVSLYYSFASTGETGFSTGPHLHWGARWKSYDRSDPWKGYFNPRLLFPQATIP